MFKNTFFILLLFVTVTSFAQTKDSVLYNKLGDFDMARFYNESQTAIRIGESILADTAKLTPKALVSFYGRLAKLYEDNEQGEKAMIYYAKVIAAVPDYYVAQRAYGYLADSIAEEVHLKIHQLKSNDPSRNALFEQYKEEVLKALPHLEKAQACDPNDQDMDMIRTLYQNIHGEQQLATLNERLVTLSKNCVDILSDE